MRIASLRASQLCVTAMGATFAGGPVRRGDRIELGRIPTGAGYCGKPFACRRGRIAWAEPFHRVPAPGDAGSGRGGAAVRAFPFRLPADGGRRGNDRSRYPHERRDHGVRATGRRARRQADRPVAPDGGRRHVLAHPRSDHCEIPRDQSRHPDRTHRFRSGSQSVATRCRHRPARDQRPLGIPCRPEDLHAALGSPKIRGRCARAAGTTSMSSRAVRRRG